MRKYGLYLILIAVTLFGTTSCGDDKDDNHAERWMIANQNALNAIRANPEYTELVSPGNEGSIFYKVIKKGNGTKPIYYTSTVQCHYKGWFVADYPEYNIENGSIFDHNLFDDGAPLTTLVGSSTLRIGWKTALQHMVEGDKWEIWMPHQLGYGRDGSRDPNTNRIIIPSYSTLAFEIEVVSVRGIDD